LGAKSGTAAAMRDAIRRLTWGGQLDLRQAVRAEVAGQMSQRAIAGEHLVTSKEKLIWYKGKSC
jgi:hypothetical protein